MKMKPMKLEGALKLYMVLYGLAFIFTFLMSVPMLMHVMPKSECLLFVQQSFSEGYVYGNPGGCMAAGVLPLVVALGALGLMFFQWLQLRKLRSHLGNPEKSSDEYREECRQTFWRMICVHCGLGTLVVIIACILSAGYAITCRNIYLVVEKELRYRILHTPNSNRGQQQVHENFASDNSFIRYTSNNVNSLGQNRQLNSITCRSLLTDSQNHYELKKNHKNNQFYSQYYGFWNNKNDNQFADVGNFEQMAFTDNLALELSMAGSWLSAVLWVVILLLLVKERHHLRAHITDESMWGGGSEYGPGSVRSASRSRKSSRDNRSLMTPVDFDVRSDHSRISKVSKSSKGTSYKDMGGARSNKGSSNSYKQMNSKKPISAVPSRLTVSRLEQVPSLPSDYGVTKLLNGGVAPSHMDPHHIDPHHMDPQNMEPHQMDPHNMDPHHMEPPNDTSSVADMSMATVTGAVIGPGMNMTPGGRGGSVRGGARHVPGGRGQSSLLDYFGQADNVGVEVDSPPAYSQMFTSESDIM